MCFRPAAVEIEKTCPKCGAKAESSETVCPSCGADLPAGPAMPGAPGVPGAPAAPGVPGAPGAPAAPGMPGAPKAPGAKLLQNACMTNILQAFANLGFCGIEYINPAFLAMWLCILIVSTGDMQ